MPGLKCQGCSRPFTVFSGQLAVVSQSPLHLLLPLCAGEGLFYATTCGGADGACAPWGSWIPMFQKRDLKHLSNTVTPASKDTSD